MFPVPTLVACEPDMMPSFPQHRLKRKNSPGEGESKTVPATIPDASAGLFDAAFDRIVSAKFIFYFSLLLTLSTSALQSQFNDLAITRS